MSSEGREKEDVDFVPPPAELAKSVSAAAEGNKNGDLSQWSGGERESLPQSKEYYCGCGPWHPPLLQVFRDARVFTFLLCLFATIEGALVSGTPASHSNLYSCKVTLACIVIILIR